MQIRHVQACLGLAMLGVCGCPSEPAPAAPRPDVGAAEPAPAEDPATFRRDAHRAAYQRLLPLAERALGMADPLAALAVADGPLVPPPAARAKHAALAEARQAAWNEAADIDARLLEADDALALQAIRFGLSRARDRLERDPARTDPTDYPARAHAFVGALERRVSSGPCPECSVAAEALGEQLAAARLRWGAASPATMAAAAQDATALAERLGTLPQRAPEPDERLERAVQEAAKQATAYAEAANRVAAALPEATESPRNKPVKVALQESEVRRLSETLGPINLRRHLGSRESLEIEAGPAFDQTLRGLAKLQAIEAEVLPAATQKTAAGPVDAAWCTTVLADLSRWAEETPAVQAARVDCDPFVRLHGGPDADPIQAWLALADLAILEPRREGARQAVSRALAMVTGEAVPRAQRHATRVLTASGLHQRGPLKRALSEARHDACLAAVAIWIHGDLGSEKKLGQALAGRCKPDPLDALRRDAIARPARALQGVALGQLGGTPTDVEALDTLWWAPLGTVRAVAAPPPGADGPSVPVKVQIEPIEPGGSDPSTAAAPDPGAPPPPSTPPS